MQSPKEAGRRWAKEVNTLEDEAIMQRVRLESCADAERRDYFIARAVVMLARMRGDPDIRDGIAGCGMEPGQFVRTFSSGKE
jgi:hypothetical protein